MWNTATGCMMHLHTARASTLHVCTGHVVVYCYNRYSAVLQLVQEGEAGQRGLKGEKGEQVSHLFINTDLHLAKRKKSTAVIHGPDLPRLDERVSECTGSFICFAVIKLWLIRDCTFLFFFLFFFFFAKASLCLDWLFQAFIIFGIVSINSKALSP